MKVTAGMAAIGAALGILTACGSEKVALPTAEPSSVSSVTTAPSKCVRPPSDFDDPDEKYLTAEIDKLQLPAGTCLFSVHMSERVDRHGSMWVTINLTVRAATRIDDLRSVATDIAHMVKRTEIGQRTSIVDVTNYGVRYDSYEPLLSDENFESHPWDGTPSREAEMAIWKIITPPK